MSSLDLLYGALDVQTSRRRAGALRLLDTPVSVLRATRRALHGIAAYGRGVADCHACSRLRQFTGIATLNLRYGFSEEDYYRFRMYRMPAAQAALFVPLRSNIAIRSRLYRSLSLDPKPLADKRQFAKICAIAGLPAAPMIADFESGAVHWWEPALPAVDLFVKEAASMCGAGAARWRYDGDDRWTCDATTLNGPALIAHVEQLSRHAPMLLQRCLQNHDAVADLGPSGLCTARVVTVRDPDSDHIDVLLAAFRMPTGGDVADNFARGGLACPVDLVTGTLGVAVRKSLALAHIDIDEHPDTGGRITGRALPRWQDVLALARRAHHVFLDYPSVGWDIAITPEGPILLEANYNWDVVLGQQAGCRPLGATRWPEHSLAWNAWANGRAL